MRRADFVTTIDDLLTLLEGESGASASFWVDNPKYQKAVQVWERATGKTRLEINRVTWSDGEKIIKFKERA